jgi:hypothetical protein
MLIKNLNEIYQKTLKTLQRFPLPTLFSILLCYFFLYKIDIKKRGFLLPDIVRQDFLKYCYILLFGFLFFIVFKLFIETRKGWLKSYYFLGTILFFSIAYYIYISPLSNLGFIIQPLLSGLFLSLLANHCFYEPKFSQEIWTFSYQLCLHLCFSILISVTLALSLFLMLYSIEYLFDIDYYKNLYPDINCIIFTIIFPILTIAGVPTTIDNLESGELKYINTALNYLAAPMLFVYTVIISIYLLKIIITWNLPKNIIITLTSIFSYLGIITYLASYPLHHNQSVIGVFRRYFFKLLPVHLLAWTVSLSVRIYHYGITEYRYFCFLSLSWLLLSTGVAFLKKSDEVPKFVLTSFPFLLLVSSFGPWSAVNVSIVSQRHRLAVLLEKNRILIAGKVQKSKQHLTSKDRQSISSIITYLVDREKLDCLCPWLTADQIAQIKSKTGTSNQAKKSQKEMVMQGLGLALPIE